MKIFLFAFHLLLLGFPKLHFFQILALIVEGVVRLRIFPCHGVLQRKWFAWGWMNKSVRNSVVIESSKNVVCHTSEIRDLRSTKCSSKTLQNLLYFMYKKTHVVFSFFISCNFIFFPMVYSTKWKRKKKTTWVFLFRIKYGKFWSISLWSFHQV